MENNKTCNNCALFHKQQEACLRTRTPTSASEFCSHFTNFIPVCDICGQGFIPPATYVIEGDRKIVTCGQCYRALSTCGTCTTNKYCDFQSNPINLPHQVQQQIQRGNMTMMTTVMNPARIAETCEKNCACWDPVDRACNRQTASTCGNYKPSYLP